jgi:Ca2+-binding EF-hand superfamily protein
MKLMDMDDDGNLTLVEFRNRSPSNDTIAHLELLGKEIFNALDEDNSGSLDQTEIPSELISLVEKTDGDSTNDDEKLSLAEWFSLVFHSSFSTRQQGSPNLRGANPLFNALNKDDDKFVDESEVSADFIALHDKNGDGKLDVDEFDDWDVFSEASFEALDNDNSGSLCTTELSEDLISMGEEADGISSNNDGKLDFWEYLGICIVLALR